MQSLPFGNARKLKKPVDTPNLKSRFRLNQGLQRWWEFKACGVPFPSFPCAYLDIQGVQGVPRSSKEVSGRFPAEPSRGPLLFQRPMCFRTPAWRRWRAQMREDVEPVERLKVWGVSADAEQQRICGKKLGIPIKVSLCFGAGMGQHMHCLKDCTACSLCSIQLGSQTRLSAQIGIPWQRCCLAGRVEIGCGVTNEHQHWPFGISWDKLSRGILQTAAWRFLNSNPSWVHVWPTQCVEQICP